MEYTANNLKYKTQAHLNNAADIHKLDPEIAEFKRLE